MQELESAKVCGVKISSPSKKGFWKRQFQARATGGQKISDWSFGVILPVVCFVLDPIVFETGDASAPILGKYKAFAYLLSFVSVMAMSAWLIWGAKLKWLNAFLAGLFLTGTIVSLVVGVILFPFSMLGLAARMPIAFLGFTPLFSAIVFLRNTARAYRTSKPTLENKAFAGAFTLGVMFSAIAPWTINAEINRTLDEMTEGDAQTIRADARKLKFVAPLIESHDLARRCGSGGKFDSDERKVLAEVYQDLTGKTL